MSFTNIFQKIPEKTPTMFTIIPKELTSALNNSVTHTLTSLYYDINWYKHNDIYNIFSSELKLAHTSLQEPILKFSEILQASS